MAKSAPGSAGGFPGRSTYGVALETDDLALDQHFAKTVTLRGVPRVFRPQLDVVGPQEKTFDRGFLMLDQGHHDFAVLSILTGFAQHQIARQDAGALHGITLDPQGKEIVAPVNIAVDNDHPVPFLLGIQGQAGRDPADDGYFPEALSGRMLPPRI